MKERKWTPGPWRLSPYYATTGYSRIAENPSRNRWQGLYEPVPGQVLGSRSTIIGVGIKGNVDDYWLSIKDADAHLIAAAPELYEALDTLVGAYRKLYEDTQPVDDLDCDKPFAKAAEALAKARGE